MSVDGVKAPFYSLHPLAHFICGVLENLKLELFLSVSLIHLLTLMGIKVKLKDKDLKILFLLGKSQRSSGRLLAVSVFRKFRITGLELILSQGIVLRK